MKIPTIVPAKRRVIMIFCRGEPFARKLASTVWWEADRQNKDWPSTQPYEYSDYNSSDEQSLTFDSYMIPDDDLELGQLCLLEVDNRVVIPNGLYVTREFMDWIECIESLCSEPTWWSHQT